jgi:predicted TIM-barrel fold metal-dependent hydrolase
VRRRLACAIAARADRHAEKLGISRREFLGSSLGLATLFLALNEVFGSFFDVDPAEALEPAAFAERSPRTFVLDAQTQHVAAPRKFPALLELRRRARRWNRGPRDEDAPERREDAPDMSDLYVENFIKEVFVDSETSVAVLSGIPAATDLTSVLPPGEAAATRDTVNRLASSRRLLAHGLIAPNKGASDLDAMRRQASGLRPDAWKGYTGLPFGDPPRAWRLDDETVAYPMLEEARRLGVRVVCLHKGLPFTGTKEDDWHPRDLARAARDFPDLTFVVSHAGFRSLAAALDATRDGFRRSARVDWVTDLCEMRASDPALTNVYAEIGSTFAMTVSTAPLLCGHILGMLRQHFGDDHVLWATDSILWGSPQWQIEALRRFRMPAPLGERFGYPPFSRTFKAKLLGLNAARVYGIDPAAPVRPIPPDYVSRMRG